MSRAAFAVLLLALVGCTPARNPKMAENVATARADIATLRAAAEAFVKANTRCPTGKELERRADPWGRAYIVLCPGQNGHAVDVVSKGKDGDLGTTDDVRSWD